jgi:hypothetical protein
MEYTEEFNIKMKKPKWVSSITRELDGHASSGFSSPDDVSYCFAFIVCCYIIHLFVSTLVFGVFFPLNLAYSEGWSK